mgnify:CR=1 FL=1|tara:strand:- start:3224 stop:3697 length:474 start_codon:yes stop_codon:yes gene_type:complete
MKLTTRGKYAVTALLDLTMNQEENKFISLSKIAERQDLPITYLEQLFLNLRSSGIVEASRGPSGGYRLTRPSSEVNLFQVISSVEGKMDATQCGGTADCQSGSRCLAHDLWTDLTQHVDNFLLKRSLDDVILKLAPAISKSASTPRQIRKIDLIAKG